jgi:2-polyprenyl-3-methyl-5-hydroxy-6-metoxy-1,4-benzoquinol methylase
MRLFDCRETELMDRPQPVSRELEETLRQLEFLNRHFGGHRYALRFLAKRFRSGESYRVLDMATGGGDFPRVMVDWARKRGVDLRIDAVDASSAILALAERFSAGYSEIRYHEGNALSFDGGVFYDLVHCSLSLHHFSAVQAVAVLQHCRELTREWVLVTDLERTPFTRLAVHWVNVLLRHRRMAIQDGDTSARRAFSYREYRALAKAAGWPEFGHERFLFCRQALWLPA